MLVRTFKTAAEIGLPQHEYEVLIQLLGMMERGEVTEGLFDMERIGNPDAARRAASSAGPMRSARTISMLR